LNDNGCPTLKKSAFSIPGYRRVIKQKKEIEGVEFKEYVIDNQNI
jgi:hypothetical protein